MTRLAAYGACLGIALTLLCGCDGRGTLYHPGAEKLADIRQYAAVAGLAMWPADNGDYRAIVSRKGPKNSRGTVVVFHGNGGPAVFRSYYIDALERRGYRVVLAEYPAYGGRGGELGEKSFVADARTTALRAREAFGGPLFLLGESLGCGVAAALACDDKLRPRGVVLITPWDTLANEADATFPWLPTRIFLADRYDSVANLSRYKGPVAVVMAGRDEIVPNRLTENLFKALPGPKRMWTFPDAGHNDWPSGPELAWWTEVMDFIDTKD